MAVYFTGIMPDLLNQPFGDSISSLLEREIKVDAKYQVVKQRDGHDSKKNDFFSNGKLHWVHCTRRQRTLRIDQHFSNEPRLSLARKLALQNILGLKGKVRERIRKTIDIKG